MLNFIRQIILSILFCSTHSVYSAEFEISEEVIGLPGMTTECFTGGEKKNDFCKTHFAFDWDFLSGADFGTLTIAITGGTEKYSSSNGECGVILSNGRKLQGTKEIDYRVTQSFEFTFCKITGSDALNLANILIKDERMTYYEPKFNGKNRNQSYYPSDIGLGFFSDATLNSEIIMGALLHHLDISNKRTLPSYSTSYKNTISWIRKKNTLLYFKIYAKLKLYQ